MRIINAAEYKDAPIRWLWPGRVPIGRVCICEGEPGTGKSQLTMEIASIVSRGGTFPDGEVAEPGQAIVINIEDPGTIIKARLVAAGAKLEFVEIMDLDTPGIEPLVIPTNVPTLAKVIEYLNAQPGKPPVRYLSIDPLDSFASEQIDLNRSQHARKALRSIELLASRFRIACLVIRHLSKSRGKSALHRGLGSISIVGAARSAITVAKDPSNPRQSIVAPVKQNWSKEATPWAFQIEPVNYQTEDGEAIETSKIRWIGPANISADELVGEQESYLKPGELEAAVDFIRAELGAGAKTNKSLRSEANNCGLSGEALWKASRIVGVMRRQNDDGEWMWELRGTEGVDFT